MSADLDTFPNGEPQEPLTRERLTELIVYLAERWPEVSIVTDEDDEIVSVEGAEPARLGRPRSPKRAFRGAAMAIEKVEEARRFLEQDNVLYRAGHHLIEDRADKSHVSFSTYRKRLTLARRRCPEYPRRIRGRNDA